MSDRKIYDLTGEDLAKELVGKHIVAATDGTITLSDGTALIIEDTSDCCAYINGVIENIDLSDNVITAVEYEDADMEEYDEHWKLNVLSNDKRVLAIDIDGTSSNGYYCHSINLVVKR